MVTHLIARLADRDRAGDVSRAVEILRAGIEQIEIAGFEATLGLRHRAVMHDRTVWPGAGDGREAQIAEMIAGTAKLFQSIAGGDLGELPLWRLARQPSQKTGHRRAIATMGGSGALELDRILAGFRQQAGIGGAVDPAAGVLQPVEDPRRRGCRIDLNALTQPGEFVECRAEPVRWFDRHRIAEMAVETGGQLA